MDRKQLQALAEQRRADAELLLNHKHWAGAYYFSGYVIECGLKACVLKYLGESAAVFSDEKYLKSLAGCWTHDLSKLVNLAGLDAEFEADRGANRQLDLYWTVVKDWKEDNRYQSRDEVEARALYEAIIDEPNGVLKWIKSRW